MIQTWPAKVLIKNVFSIQKLSKYLSNVTLLCKNNQIAKVLTNRFSMKLDRDYGIWVGLISQPNVYSFAFLNYCFDSRSSSDWCEKNRRKTWVRTFVRLRDGWRKKVCASKLHMGPYMILNCEDPEKGLWMFGLVFDWRKWG